MIVLFDRVCRWSTLLSLEKNVIRLFHNAIRDYFSFQSASALRSLVPFSICVCDHHQSSLLHVHHFVAQCPLLPCMSVFSSSSPCLLSMIGHRSSRKKEYLLDSCLDGTSSHQVLAFDHLSMMVQVDKAWFRLFHNAIRDWTENIFLSHLITGLVTRIHKGG